MRSFCTLIAMCALVYGQATQRQTSSAGTTPPPHTTEPSKPEVKPEDKCTLEGTVVNSLTGEPLRKAHLNLRAIGELDAASYGTDTNAAGHFVLDDVDPGRYSFMASRNGFAGQSYSPQGSLKRSTTVTLVNGQKLKEIVFKLTPQGVITGRIQDEDGDPMARVQVQAMTFSYPRGKKQLIPAGAGSTTDLGEFRIFGLRAGRYVISATYQPPNAYMASTERIVGPAQTEEGYPTTYYPNASNPESASQVEVAAGAQIQGITMTLVRTRTVRLKGRVMSGPAQQSRRNINLMLMPRSSNSFMFMMRNTVRVLDSNGTFEMRGVAPGSYYLWATYMEDNQRYDARVPIDVGDTNITGIEVSLRQAAEINGRIVVEENGDVKGATVNVYLQPKLEGINLGGSGGPVKNDLSFKLMNVTPDPYDLNVFGLPEGFYLKSIRMGDQDVTLTGLDFTEGLPISEIAVIVNPNGGQVEGHVENAKGEAAVGAMVTLIPDESHRTVSWLYKTANTDQNGHFLIKGVRPGEYKIYAWEEIENGAYQDPEYVKPHESAGKSISAKESSHEVVQLTTIAADDAGLRGRN